MLLIMQLLDRRPGLTAGRIHMKLGFDRLHCTKQSLARLEALEHVSGQKVGHTTTYFPTFHQGCVPC